MFCKKLSPRNIKTLKSFKFQVCPFAKQGKNNGNGNNDGKDKKKKLNEEKEEDNVVFENDYLAFQGMSRNYERSDILKTNKRRWSDESFVVNLFRGELQPNQVFPFPNKLKNSAVKEVEVVSKPLEDFLKNVNNAEMNDNREEIPKKAYAHLKDIGILKLCIPQEYGGLGFSYLQNTRCLQIIGMYDLNIAGFLSGHQGLGYKALELFGTPYLKEKYFTMITKENKVAAFALFEEAVESDFGSIKTRATLDKSKKYYILNGVKTNVINGGIADIFTVFAVTRSEDDELRIRAFIVEKSFAGVIPGASTKRMGMRGMNCTKVEFKNVKVPVENFLGENVDGYLMAMRILNYCRYGVSGYLSGALKSVMFQTVQFLSESKYSSKNRIVVSPIGKKMGDITVSQYLLESLAIMIGGNLDNGFSDFFLEAAIAKCFASNKAFRSVDNMIQIFGNKGYQRGTGLERVLRNIRFFRLYSGTNDILRLFISLTGIQYASIDYPDIQAAFNNPKYNLGLVFGRPTPAKLPQQMIPNLRLTFSHLVHPSLHEAAERATKSVLHFGKVVQLMMERYGREVIEDQKNLIALSDASIYVYAMVVALARCSSSLYRELSSASSELIIVESFSMSAANYIHNLLERLESKTRRNIRNRFNIMMQHLISTGQGYNPKFNPRQSFSNL